MSIDWSNLNGALLGISILALGAFLALGSIAGALVLIAGGLAFVAIGFYDWLKNGATAENTMALAFGVAIVAGALMMVNAKLGLAVGLVGIFAIAFLANAQEACGAVNVFVQWLQNAINYGRKLQDALLAVFSNLGSAVGNLAAATFEVMKVLGGNIATAMKNAWDSVRIGFNGFQLVVLSGVREIMLALNKLTGVFGLEFDTGGVTEKINALAAENEALSSGQGDYESLTKALERGFTTFEYEDVKAAFGSVAAFEEGWLRTAWTQGREYGANLEQTLRTTLAQAFHVAPSAADDDAPLDSSGLLAQFQTIGEKYTAGFGDTSRSLTDLSALTKAGTDDAASQFIEQLEFMGVAKEDWTELSGALTMDSISAARGNASGVCGEIVTAADRIVAAVQGIQINIHNSYSTAQSLAPEDHPTTEALFLNSEAKSELVGQMNGRTTLAGKEQLLGDVTEGMYQAVAAAMRQVGGAASEPAAFHVYLSGKQIAAEVEKVQRGKGAQIFAGGLA